MYIKNREAILQIQAEVPLDRDKYEQMTCKSRKSLDDES